MRFLNLTSSTYARGYGVLDLRDNSSFLPSYATMDVVDGELLITDTFEPSGDSSRWVLTERLGFAQGQSAKMDMMVFRDAFLVRLVEGLVYYSGEIGSLVPDTRGISSPRMCSVVVDPNTFQAALGEAFKPDSVHHLDVKLVSPAPDFFPGGGDYGVCSDGDFSIDVLAHTNLLI